MVNVAEFMLPFDEFSLPYIVITLAKRQTLRELNHDLFSTSDRKTKYHTGS